jgi:uncharacterized membrane protein (DUF2068 family)
MKSGRPVSLTIAVLLLGLDCLLQLATPLVPGPPPAIVALSIVIGVLGVVAAVGLWMLQRWAIMLTLILMFISILSAAPGLIVQPKATSTIGSAVSIALAALTVVLTLAPSVRQLSA